MPIPEMRAVESSNVEAVGHDGADLYVRFKGGATYVYSAVPTDMYAKLLADKSVGRFLNSCIKGAFACEKVSDGEKKTGGDDSGKVKAVLRRCETFFETRQSEGIGSADEMKLLEAIREVS